MPNDDGGLVRTSIDHIRFYRAERVPGHFSLTDTVIVGPHGTGTKYEPRHAYDKRDPFTTVSIIDLGIGDPFRVRIPINPPRDADYRNA